MIKTTRGKAVLALAIFFILLLAAYLPYINKTGYLQDDWNTLFVTEQRGAGSLVDHYSIDRPLRGYFSLLEYRIMNTKMVGYQITALLWRYLDAVIIFLILMLIWPKKWWTNVIICSLIIIFPGFHEQTNAFEYQAHLFSRMCMVFSIYISLLALSVKNYIIKVFCVIFAVILAQVSYGLMEYYIGLEALRFVLLFVFAKQKLKSAKINKLLIFMSIFLVNAAAFTYWRLFIFQARRASVDTANMLSGYQEFFPKLLSNLRDLFVNLYRLVISAYYQPLIVFTRNIHAGALFIGIGLALVATVVVILLVRKINDISAEDQAKEKNYSVTLILVGLIGSIGALIPIVFAGREITYVLSGDRFSYPGSISASILLVGLLSLIKLPILKNTLIFALIFIGLLTQYTNDVIFELNYIQTNETWWQLSWRAPQILKTTLISGSIDYGMNDEDYTFWGPANLLYYPGEKDLQITAEVLDDTTKSSFLSQVKDTYTRKTITFDRDFGNLLIFTKDENACLHVIDGKHPEFSKDDNENIREVGLLSDLGRIDVNSSFNPQPRVDLFGSEPTQGWCYYYEKAQLERQKGNWTLVAQYGEEALKAKLVPSDPMEWLVFLQAFAYTDDPMYGQVKQNVVNDVYTNSQVCGVFSSYTDGISKSQYKEKQEKLINDVCP